jgi:hypothetical protein
MLHGVGWLANVVPVFGKPWVLDQEFPLYQWCVALVVDITREPLGSVGRAIAAFFAIVSLGPAFLLAKAFEFPCPRRMTLLVGTLWLLAPVVAFWSQDFLIETMSVFCSLSWLAFYVRFISQRGTINFAFCLGFGILAATVKVTTFSGFVVVGLLYTGVHLWRRRWQFRQDLVPVLLPAAISVATSGVALLAWNHYTDHFLRENPLAAQIRVSNIPTWYFGTLPDRWSLLLWKSTILNRDLPDAFGRFWPIALFSFGLLSLLRFRLFPIVMALVAGYVSVYLFFPRLHIYNSYYQIENVIFLCTAFAVSIDRLIEDRKRILAYGLFASVAASQIWTFYNHGPCSRCGSYWTILNADAHKNPYYMAGMAVKASSPKDSVVVVFGDDWSSEIPYAAERHAIVIANWFPVSVVYEMLLDEPDRWFGHLKLGAVVDCTVPGGLSISPALVSIRDALIKDLKNKTNGGTGNSTTRTVDTQYCKIFVSQG